MHFIEKIEGDVCTVILAGRFTFADQKPFNNFINDILQAPIRELILDFNETDFIDSVALGLLLIIRDKTTDLNITLTLRSPQGKVLNSFEVVRFDKLFTIEA